MTVAVDNAHDFILRNGRLLERRLFERLWRSGPAAAVVSALAAYQNADGGFGSGLEPDKRDPGSQPVDLQIALEVLDMAGAAAPEMIARACDWLGAAATPEGGLPFALPSVNDFPHAPWWEVPAETGPASLNPTAAVAGLLLKSGVSHPAVERAARFCWAALEASATTDFHDVMPILTFLAHAPDRDRAGMAITALKARVAAPGVVTLDPGAEGYVQKPLDFAPTPQSPLADLFPRDVLDRHLDALAARQQADGGWALNWETVGPGATLEARSMVTVRALATLQAYGRI